MKKRTQISKHFRLFDKVVDVTEEVVNPAISFQDIVNGAAVVDPGELLKLSKEELVALVGRMTLVNNQLNETTNIQAAQNVELTAENIVLKAENAQIGKIAVERALEIESLQNESLTDQLTGIGNRRAFERAFTDIQEELHRRNYNNAFEHEQSEEGAFAVLLIDVDDFKEINDRLGHPMGDEALRNIAAAVDAILRGNTTDSIYRIGGDEFAIIVKISPLNICATMKAIKKRIREAIQDASVDFSNHIYNPDNLQLKVSIGWSLIEAGDENVVSKADTSLYVDKSEKNLRTHEQ